MDMTLLGILGFALLLLLIILRTPIAAAMAITGFLGTSIAISFGSSLSIFSTEMVSALISQDLSIIPIFILLGGFAQISGLSARLFAFAQALFCWISGGMAMAVIITCAGFGAICGSSVATTSTMTKTSFDELLTRGYHPKIIAGSIMGGGTLGSLIPPSMVMIIYAALTEQDLMLLFKAAIIPSIIAVIFYCSVIALIARRSPNYVPKTQKINPKQLYQTFLKAVPAIIIILAILIGFYGGFVSIFEASALALSLTMLWSLYQYIRYQAFSKQRLQEMLIESAGQIAMIYTILIGAKIYGYFFVISHLPQQVSLWVLQLGTSPVIILTIIIILYLILGAVFDSLAAMVITIPFTFPIVTSLGFDPIWWGIINVVIIEIGLITPPIGMNLFTLQAIRPELSLSQIYQSAFPFVVADIFRVILLLLFPTLILYLI